MAILIEGMEMPKAQFQKVSTLYHVEGTIFVYPDGKARAELSVDYKERKSYPIVPVQPHGRLIDADVLKKVVASAKHMDADIYDGRLFYSDHLCVGADYDDVCKAIDETPTIIPASKGAE